MYKTIILEKYGLVADYIKNIDNMANKMYEEGYELVTYQYTQNYEQIMMTFKKVK